jgi:hypothetical protein
VHGAKRLAGEPTERLRRRLPRSLAAATRDGQVRNVARDCWSARAFSYPDFEVSLANLKA